MPFSLRHRQLSCSNGSIPHSQECLDPLIIFNPFQCWPIHTRYYCTLGIKEEYQYKHTTDVTALYCISLRAMVLLLS